MDWKSIVTQLMAVEKGPQDKVKAKVASLSTRQTALDNIKTSLLSLQTSAKAMSFGTGTSNPRSASMVGNPSDASVSTADSATMGTFQIIVGGTKAGAGGPAASASSKSLLAGNANSSISSGTASNSVLYGKAAAIADSSALMSLRLGDYGVTAGTVTVGGVVVTIGSDDIATESGQGKTLQAFLDDLKASVGSNFDYTQDPGTGVVMLKAPTGPGTQSIGSGGDTSNVLSVLGFSQGSYAGMKLSDYGVSEGTISVGGASVTVDATDLTKSVGEFLSKFSAAVPGLTYSVNEASGSVSLTSPVDPLNPPARQPIGDPSDTSDFLSKLGFSIQGTAALRLNMVQTVPSKALGAKVLSGSDTLTINGVTLGPFDTSSATFTVSSVISAINNSTKVGVKASIDPMSQRVLLTSTSSGRMGITVSGNLAGALGLSDGGTPWNETSSDPGAGAGYFQRGTALEFNLMYNGRLVKDASGNALLKSDSNSIDLSQFGFGGTKITISPTSDIANLSAPVTYTATVSGAASEARKKVETFISSYNTLRQLVADNTKVTVGSDGKVSSSVLSDNKELAGLSSKLRLLLLQKIEDATNTRISTTYNSMSKIGLGFDKAGVMSITNSSTLDAALSDGPTAVDAMLNSLGTASTSTQDNSATQGLGSRVSYLVDSLTGTSGLFVSITDSIKSQTTRLQKQITDLDRSLAAKQKTLETSFIAMERAQSKMQSQASALTQAFSNNSSK